MKHAAAVVLCILLLWVPARAADTLSDQKSAGQASMQNALDGEAQSLLSGLDGTATSHKASILYCSARSRSSRARSNVRQQRWFVSR